MTPAGILVFLAQLQNPLATSYGTNLHTEKEDQCCLQEGKLVSFANDQMEFTFIDTCSVTRFSVQTCCNVTVELGEVAIFRNHCNKNKIKYLG